MELFLGYDPLNKNSHPIDSDGDGTSDEIDPDELVSERITYNNNTVYNNTTANDDDDNSDDEESSYLSPMIMVAVGIAILISIIALLFAILGSRKQ